MCRVGRVAVSCASRRQNENISKEIAAIFSKFNLKVTSEANSKRVDFLDAIFDLDEETYEPYNKPKNIPQYVHRLSNHPPSVLKNIPSNVNKRLSSRSSNEKMFLRAAPLFQEAIDKSGYNFKLKFDPPPENPPPPKRKRSRNDNALWFNPPFNATVKTNIGKKFLSLIDECFPPGHKLRKIFNRQTVKVSYCTTPNMSQIIAGKNKKVLQAEREGTDRKCSCPSTKICPLDEKCLTDNLIYQATATKPNSESKTYIGLSSTEFKKRLGTHTDSFKHREKQNIQTSLSKYVWELRDQGVEPKITWKIIDRGKPFSPTTGVCQLCTKEKFYIMYRQEMAQLNSKSEIFNHCRHIKPALLFKPPKKKSPGS